MVSFDKIQIKHYPYTHIIVDDFLNDVKDVLKNWEDINWIQKYREDFLSENNINYLKNELAKHFPSFNKSTKVEEFIKNTHTYPELQLIRGSHLDGIDKAYNAVIYIDDINYCDPYYAGSFQIMEDLDDNKTPLSTINYKHNRAVFFECGKTSYHRFWSRPPYRRNFSFSFIK